MITKLGKRGIIYCLPSAFPIIHLSLANFLFTSPHLTELFCLLCQTTGYGDDNLLFSFWKSAQTKARLAERGVSEAISSPLTHGCSSVLAPESF